MSLLRSCQHTLVRCPAARAAAAQTHAYSDSVVSAAGGKSEIVTQQPQEIITADDISGAPGEYTPSPLITSLFSSRILIRGTSSPDRTHLPAHSKYYAERLGQDGRLAH